jgi:hypothetical protein
MNPQDSDYMTPLEIVRDRMTIPELVGQPLRVIDEAFAAGEITQREARILESEVGAA